MISRTIESRGVAALADGARSLLSAAAVRGAAERLFDSARGGNLEHWTVHLDKLARTADFVAGVVRAHYPELDVPVHARWRHFVIGGRNLWEDLRAGAPWRDAASGARSAFDLAITSVLLDAGAGAGWTYQDRATGLRATRSEGLALASLRWFEDGGLSNDLQQPLRADAAALRRVDTNSLERALQSDDANQLPGLEGRAALLNRLGKTVDERPELFAIADSPRPGGLFDAMRGRASAGRLPAGTILEMLLDALGPIWQHRPTLNGVPLGDCWPHPALLGQRPEDAFAPLHKLSQWLAYSLIEPLELAGISVTDVDDLTALAEYRNGGLLIDTGVLELRAPSDSSMSYAVAHPLVVGWRSLTVALLDRLAPLVAERLGFTSRSFPLSKVLEGGTWTAGRLVARNLRPDGGPPLHVVSDGTVF